MLGYWGLPEETAACLRPGLYPGERVLHTGDVFRTDEEGFLYFLGRRDEMIKSGGEKISPAEIENVLYALDGVEAAAVVGVPDALLGEAIVACVSPKAGSLLTEREVLRHCAEFLERHLVPRRVVFLGSLPRTANGKINKGELLGYEALRLGAGARKGGGVR
jgi:acyl-CoA synthetase (AMP-forming)/AMP-acid ligase II